MFDQASLDLDLEDVTEREIYRGLKEAAERYFIWTCTEPGGVVVDVGANIGLMTVIAANRVGPRGRVYSVEPNPAIRERLAANTRQLPNVEILPFAVGSDVGEASLSVPSGHSGLASLAHASVGGTEVVVPVRRLDDVLPVRVRIGMMKIDVEGFEGPAIMGASQTLASGRVRNILIEYTPEWTSQEWLAELLAHLGEGYLCRRIAVEHRRGLWRVPVLHSFDPGGYEGSQCSLLISRDSA
jgi:FkbM family methyltransferase